MAYSYTTLTPPRLTGSGVRTRGELLLARYNPSASEVHVFHAETPTEVWGGDTPVWDHFVWGLGSP